MTDVHIVMYQNWEDTEVFCAAPTAATARRIAKSLGDRYVARTIPVVSSVKAATATKEHRWSADITIDTGILCGNPVNGKVKVRHETVVMRPGWTDPTVIWWEHARRPYTPPYDYESVKARIVELNAVDWTADQLAAAGIVPQGWDHPYGTLTARGSDNTDVKQRFLEALAAYQADPNLRNANGDVTWTPAASSGGVMTFGTPVAEGTPTFPIQIHANGVLNADYTDHGDA